MASSTSSAVVINLSEIPIPGIHLLQDIEIADFTKPEFNGLEDHVRICRAARHGNRNGDLLTISDAGDNGATSSGAILRPMLLMPELPSREEQARYLQVWLVLWAQYHVLSVGFKHYKNECLGDESPVELLWAAMINVESWHTNIGNLDMWAELLRSFHSLAQLVGLSAADVCIPELGMDIGALPPASEVTFRRLFWTVTLDFFTSVLGKGKSVIDAILDGRSARSELFHEMELRFGGGVSGPPWVDKALDKLARSQARSTS
ncbi:hypothetical protein B0T16DRAFT_1307 [Cercophora newfieldiana]|uniref:Uncharacterized protein n=1 Tax=Cercophora newfieldiana TaxID=92897 RepID=A0AA40CX77_9PEZI|nr:hypothetical protein B0T16DRAFT_1307 [Cercophora newfieldiana]